MDAIIYVLYFVIGACVGSFCNVIICRCPIGLSINNPKHSYCFSCGHQIKFYENIPILSYIFLRGRCKHCKAKIPIRDFFVELCSALLYLLSAIMFYNVNFLFSMLLCLAISVLIVISCIDIDHQYISEFSLIFLSAISIPMFATFMFGDALEHVIGLAVGGGFLLIVYLLGLKIKKQEVVGVGDIILMAVCGLMVGWKNILLAYVIAFVVSCIVLVSIMIKNRTKDLTKHYPFIPFLSLGVLVSMFFGEYIINWYIGLFIF